MTDTEKYCYLLELKTNDGKLVDRKELGTWRDNAREEFARIKWKMGYINTAGTLDLIDPNGKVECHHEQMGNVS
jgi:hypothetical protein